MTMNAKNITIKVKLQNVLKKSDIREEKESLNPLPITDDMRYAEPTEQVTPKTYPIREVQYVQGVARQGNNLRVQELQKIYGLGLNLTLKACRACGILLSTRAGQLQSDQIRALEKLLEEETLTGSDRKKVEYENINRHMSRGSYRGIRMRIGLPVRGQRTKTNAYTARKLNVHRGKVKA